MKWRTIETAPIDETVFCYHPLYGRFPGYQRLIMHGCEGTVWINHYDGCAGIMPPTHWMPLPEAPKE